MLNYFADHVIDELKINISSNTEDYKKETTFVEDKYMLDPLWRETIENINIQDLKLVNPDENEDHEIVNTILVYKSLKRLTPIQASDERLWAYLTHIQFWDYMRKRWPVEKAKNEDSRILERYFFISNLNRALVRHGIARLWWYGYYAYDPLNKEDPYWLVKTLVENHSFAQEVLERSFSNNKNIVLAILKLVKEMEDKEENIKHRDFLRPLMKYINIKGGALVLDMLDADDIKDILKEKYIELLNK